MDYKLFLPDFNSLNGTDWSKPRICFDTKLHVITIIAVAMMFLSVFIQPWYEVTFTYNKYTSLGPIESAGLDQWQGIMALILSIIAFIGCLYGKYSFVISAALLSAIFAFTSILNIPALELMGREFSSDEVGKEITRCINLRGEVDQNRFGAYLNITASVVCVVSTYKLLKTSK